MCSAKNRIDFSLLKGRSYSVVCNSGAQDRKAMDSFSTAQTAAIK